MGTNKKISDNSRWKLLDEKIEKGLKRTAERLVIEEKRKKGYFIIADKDGVVKKVPANKLK